jgi:hypothetical protein
VLRSTHAPSPELDPLLNNDLCTALEVKVLPPDFATSIHAALDTYATVRENSDQWPAIEQTVAAAIRACGELEKRIAAVQGAIDPEVTPSVAFACRELLSAVQDARAAVAEDGVMAPAPRGSKRGGNPHPGRGPLVEMVFGALEDDLGIVPTKYRASKTASVVAAVLKAADRLDNVKVRRREDFSAATWSGWIETYRALRAAERRIAAFREEKASVQTK